MVEPSLSERQQRELEFHEQFARLKEVQDVCFDPILGREKRPWNEYWRVCEIVQGRFQSGDQRLLDFGCGVGEFSVLFARVGYEVFGFDISPSNIAMARALAAKYQLSDRTHFDVRCAEQLDYPSDYFDLIVGVDILHHVEIRSAVSECLRVLKPGGLALFREPMAVPLFDTLRNSRFGRWLVPNGVSYERYITEDERKLTAHELRSIRSLDADLSIQRFRLISRLDKFISNQTMLQKLDLRLLTALPPLRRWGGTVLLTIRKPPWETKHPVELGEG